MRFGKFETVHPKYGTSWEEDDRVTSCGLCDVEFGVFTRKHHCRFCGRIRCADCMPAKEQHPQSNSLEFKCDLCVSKKCQFIPATQVPPPAAKVARTTPVHHPEEVAANLSQPEIAQGELPLGMRPGPTTVAGSPVEECALPLGFKRPSAVTRQPTQSLVDLLHRQQAPEHSQPDEMQHSEPDLPLGFGTSLRGPTRCLDAANEGLPLGFRGHQEQHERLSDVSEGPVAAWKQSVCAAMVAPNRT